MGPSSVSAGTVVMGLAADGNQVAGEVLETTSAGATVLQVRYQTTDSQKNYVNCQVGAATVPNTEGCYAPTGTLDVGGTEIAYSYDPLTANKNTRTLKGLSTELQASMKSTPTLQAFVDYYGMYDYGDGWGQVIKKGTAYVIVWMWVLREMEEALSKCSSCSSVNDDAVCSWDSAVAFYTGTLEGTDGSGSGKFPYALADKRCGNFKTCGDMADSTTGGSWVNLNIFDNFRQGQANLSIGNCDAVRGNMATIESLMYIPLIQGTLRYAWKTDNEAYSEKAEAEGVIFYAGIAPMIHKCDPEAAKTIGDMMQAGQAGTAQYTVVLEAFEKTYECLGIAGPSVGGSFDAASGMYFPGAEPMEGKMKAASSMLSLAAGAGVVVASTLAMLW